MNVETWYFIQRGTTPATFYECDDLLQTSQLSQRSKRDEVVYAFGGSNNYLVPIPTTNYTVIAGSKIYTASAGTYTLGFYTTTSNAVTVYTMRASTGVLATSTVSFPAPSVYRTHTVSLAASDTYTIIFHQNNTSTNTTVFVNTAYTGVRLPKHLAYSGGEQVILRPASSTVAAVGDYKWSARSADFDGWLVCNGRAIYREAYPQLFAVIGTSFGVGNGTTTFNLPDARGRVCASVGTGSGLTERTLGQSTGEEAHTLTSGEMPVHNHGASTNTVAAHTHTYQDAYFAENTGGGANNLFGTQADTDNDNSFRYRTAGGGDSTAPSDLTTGAGGSHSHAVTVGNAGSGGSHNVMQPTLFIGNLFICAEI